MRVAERRHGEELTEAVCRYALAVSDVAPKRLAELVSDILQRPEDTIMSTLQRTYLKGKAEGKAEGRVEALVRQLSKRFGALSAATTRRIRVASARDLDRWTDRVLDAKTLAEVFAD